MNQRGQTEYTAAGYTIDRWSIGSGATLTLTNGSLYISAGNLITYLESGSNLFSKTVTFSMLTQSGLVSGTARLGDSYAVWDATSLYDGVAFQYRSNDVFALLISKGVFLSGAIAVKLELGSTQTLAHQDANGNWVLNEIPDYGEQLARCQRYYYQTWTGASPKTDKGYIGFNAGTNNSTPDVFRPPVTMRTTPSVTVYNPLTGNESCVSDYNSDAEIAGIINYTGKTTEKVIMLNHTQKLTNGRKYICHLKLDAEMH